MKKIRLITMGTFAGTVLLALPAPATAQNYGCAECMGNGYCYLGCSIQDPTCGPCYSGPDGCSSVVTGSASAVAIAVDGAPFQAQPRAELTSPRVAGESMLASQTTRVEMRREGVVVRRACDLIVIERRYTDTAAADVESQSRRITI